MDDTTSLPRASRWQHFKAAVHAILLEKDPPPRIARGMAIGIFVGFLPIMGIQMPVSTAIALPLRGNLKAAIAGVWITNPLTFIPFYFGCYRFGLLLMPSRQVEWSEFQSVVSHASEWSWANVEASLARLADIGADIFWPLWLGSTVLGVAFGTATYFVTLAAVKRLRYRDASSATPDRA